MRRLSFTLGLLALFGGASFALAQTASSTSSAPTFPITELGNCSSKQECKAYCDVEEHKEACLSYAESHNLMPKAKIAIARSFQAALKTSGGPGGCTQTQSCREYCSNPSHAAECRAFAELHGFMRLKNAMGSSTPMKMGSSTEHRPPKMGSSSPMLPFGEHPRGSTTAPRFDNRGEGSLNQGPGKGIERFIPGFLRKDNRGPGSQNSGRGGEQNEVEDEQEAGDDHPSAVPRTSWGAAVINFILSL